MRFALALVVLVLGACSNATEPRPLQIAGAVPFADTALLARLWSKTEACSGLKGDLSSVSFYKVPSVDVVNTEGNGGYWFRDGNRIFIADAWAGSASLITHEIMHALLQSGAHPPQYFNGVCGDLMTITIAAG